MNLCAYCISVAYMDACVSGFIEVVASFQPALAGHFIQMGAAFTHFFLPCRLFLVYPATVLISLQVKILQSFLVYCIFD
jgi:hypothetical protein